MSTRLRAEYAGAAIAAGVGAWFVIESVRLGIGTALHMKAGFFPLCLGVVMIGLAILQASVLRADAELDPPDIRSTAFVMAGLVLFVLTLENLGLLISVALLVALSMLALPGSRPSHVIWLALGTALLSWAVFGLGIGVPVPAIRGVF